MMKHETVSTGTLLKTWTPFREAIGFASVKTAKDYKHASALIEQLIDHVGENENHPLADLLDYVANQVENYESEHTKIPEAPAREVLRFLMEQHGLSQSDLADCAPQSRISEILNAKREISKELAKALAKRFKVNVGVFL